MLWTSAENRPGIGSRVRDARLTAGISGQDLADRIAAADCVDGLDAATISLIEAEARAVASHELVEFAAHLSVTTRWLLGLNPSPHDSARRLPAPVGD